MANNVTQGKGAMKRFPQKHQHWCPICKQWKNHVIDDKIYLNKDKPYLQCQAGLNNGNKRICEFHEVK
jgi:hypothetical protein